MKRLFWVGTLVLGFAGAAFAAEQKSTDSIYSDFKRELLKAMKNYSTNAEMRSTATNAAKSVFEKAINEAKPAQVRTQEQVFLEYLTNVGDVSRVNEQSFGPERTMWLSAAYKVFETDAKYAKDKEEVRNTQTCFETFASRLQRVGKSLGSSQDLRNEAEKAAKKLYDDSLNIAVDSPGTDALSQFNKNLARADRTFPTGSDDEKKYNQAANSALKDAAKRAMDRSIQSQKK